MAAAKTAVPAPPIPAPFQNGPGSERAWELLWSYCDSYQRREVVRRWKMPYRWENLFVAKGETRWFLVTPKSGVIVVRKVDWEDPVYHDQTFEFATKFGIRTRPGKRPRVPEMLVHPARRGGCIIPGRSYLYAHDDRLYLADHVLALKLACERDEDHVLHTAVF